MRSLKAVPEFDSFVSWEEFEILKLIHCSNHLDLNLVFFLLAHSLTLRNAGI